jgi:hypothetical protein
MRLLVSIVLGFGIGFRCFAGSGVPVDLPYPKKRPLTGEQVAEQVYFANHFYAFKNFMIRRRSGRMSAIVNRFKGGKITLTAVERYLNNNYHDGVVRSKDLAIFRSGNLRGTGILVTDYVAEDRSQSYNAWLPELRKVRRFAQPNQADAWGGTVFTFGDVTLRSPKDESHKVLGVRRFGHCLGAIDRIVGKQIRYAGRLPKGACRHKNKKVYILRSTTKLKDWWYDYRISYVDVRSFADYRTVYIKDGKIVKVIDRDWGRVVGSKLKDRRALFWKSWYGLDVDSGQESWAIVPSDVIQFNKKQKNTFWSDRTLRKLKR